MRLQRPRSKDLPESRAGESNLDPSWTWVSDAQGCTRWRIPQTSFMVRFRRWWSITNSRSADDRQTYTRHLPEDEPRMPSSNRRSRYAALIYACAPPSRCPPPILIPHPNHPHHQHQISTHTTVYPAPPCGPLPSPAAPAVLNRDAGGVSVEARVFLPTPRQSFL